MFSCLHTYFRGHSSELSNSTLVVLGLLIIKYLVSILYSNSLRVFIENVPQSCGHVSIYETAHTCVSGKSCLGWAETSKGLRAGDTGGRRTGSELKPRDSPTVPTEDTSAVAGLLGSAPGIPPSAFAFSRAIDFNLGNTSEGLKP